MTHRLTRSLSGALLLLVLTVPAALAAPATVTVRVEGATRTLLPRTTVTTTTAPVIKDGTNSCTGTSAAGALDLATAGDWLGSWFDGLGYGVDAIKGESWAFGNPDNRYWAFWLDNAAASTGVCGAELAGGEEILFFPDCFGAGCVSPQPLALTAPSSAAVGQPVEIAVKSYAFDGTSSAVAGATVSGAGAGATTGPDGTATLTFTAAGDHVIRATKADFVRSGARTVCVHAGSDGNCGTTAPAATTQQPAVSEALASATAPACVSDGEDGTCGTRDRKRPRLRLLGIADGARFAAGKAPRTLRGVVDPDASGLMTVKIRLTRRHGGRCQYLSKRLDRLRDWPCRQAFFIAIGERAEWSFLLPERLPRGRYVLDAKAIDRAHNRDEAPERGRTRVVFHVG